MLTPREVVTGDVSISGVGHGTEVAQTFERGGATGNPEQRLNGMNASSDEVPELKGSHARHGK